jgi:hypothetical protein
MLPDTDSFCHFTGALDCGLRKTSSGLLNVRPADSNVARQATTLAGSG